MKITIEHDDGKKETFQSVTDAYLAIRQLQPMQEKKKDIALLPETRSYSWGVNLRELVKEVRQSLEELNEILRAERRK